MKSSYEYTLKNYQPKKNNYDGNKRVNYRNELLLYLYFNTVISISRAWVGNEYKSI